MHGPLKDSLSDIRPHSNCSITRGGLITMRYMDAHIELAVCEPEVDPGGTLNNVLQDLWGVEALQTVLLDDGLQLLLHLLGVHATLGRGSAHSAHPRPSKLALLTTHLTWLTILLALHPPLLAKLSWLLARETPLLPKLPLLLAKHALAC